MLRIKERARLKLPAYFPNSSWPIFIDQALLTLTTERSFSELLCNAFVWLHAGDFAAQNDFAEQVDQLVVVKRHAALPNDRDGVHRFVAVLPVWAWGG